MRRSALITHIAILSFITVLANASIAAASPASANKAGNDDSKKVRRNSEKRIVQAREKRQSECEQRQQRDKRERSADRRQDTNRHDRERSARKQANRSRPADRNGRFPAASKAVGLAMQNLDDLTVFYKEHERWEEMEWVLRRRVELPLLLAQLGPITDQLGEADAIVEYYRLIDRPDKALEIEAQLLNDRIHHASKQLHNIDKELALLEAQHEAAKQNLDQLVEAREALHTKARKLHAHQKAEHSESLEREIESLHHEIERLQGELDSHLPTPPQAVAVPTTPKPPHKRESVKRKVMKSEKPEKVRQPSKDSKPARAVRRTIEREHHGGKPAAESRNRRERPRSIEIKAENQERRLREKAPKPSTRNREERDKRQQTEPAQM